MKQNIQDSRILRAPLLPHQFNERQVDYLISSYGAPNLVETIAYDELQPIDISKEPEKDVRQRLRHTMYMCIIWCACLDQSGHRAI